MFVVGSYNLRGVNDAKWLYIDHVLNNCDFLLIQEHWLHSSKFHVFSDKLKNIQCHCVSGMDDSTFIYGRPFGGCAILWKDSLKCKVEPINVSSKRLCAVKVTAGDNSFLLCTVYMPCDGSVTTDDEYNAILSEIISIVDSTNVGQVICAGDFNTDLSRVNSTHTRCLKSFCTDHDFVLLHDIYTDIDYTYESTANGVTSVIDHFITTENMVSQCTGLWCEHSIDNLSDHSVLYSSFELECDYGAATHVPENKILWHKATKTDLNEYKYYLDVQLKDFEISAEALYCKDRFCKKHYESLQKMHDCILDSCLKASLSLPHSHSRHDSKCIPGFNEYVAPYQNAALFWHKLWKQNGSPRSGIICDIRRKTRYQYHQALKDVKKNQRLISMSNMAESILQSGNSRNFWSEVKKIRGNTSKIPNVVDDMSGEADVANLFSEKYCDLYNSVPYNRSDMFTLKNNIDGFVKCHNDNCCCEHNINVVNVVDAVKRLKSNKSDGNIGMFTNHIIHGTPRLYVYISLLFDSLLSHGFVPSELLLSTLIPIPKNKRKSLNESDNYRAIALGSILGKLMDNIILCNCEKVFSTSDLQFGFKQKHSTVQCTFVVNEVTQYYNNNNSSVFLALLDASRAFDRVEYLKLFNLLLTKGICPVVARFLLVLYTNQHIRVKWGNTHGDLFSVSNGVKQGGVLSPLLFTVYIDELLTRLSRSGYGCHIGGRFCGAVGYADDIILITPTVSSLNKMLEICCSYADEYNVLFNSSKSKIIVKSGRLKLQKPSIMLKGEPIEAVDCEMHLGNLIGNVDNNDLVSKCVSEFMSRVNMVKSHFDGLPVESLYRLFKTFCMPLYGSQLLDLSDKSIEKFFCAWRKAIRYLFRLPFRTHSGLLPLIVDDVDVESQLNRRFLKFFKSLESSGNVIVHMCVNLAKAGSRSAVSNSLSWISQCYSVSRYRILESKILYSTTTHRIEDRMTASLVIEMLNVRCGQSYVSGFDSCDIDNIIFLLCTN